MLQAWHRWRESLAVLLLVVLALLLVVRGAALGLAIESGSTNGIMDGIPGGDELLVLAAAAAVLWCATPVPAGDGEPGETSRHSRPIAVAGLIVVGLTVLGWLALSIWGVVNLAQWPTPDAGSVLFVVEGILRLAIPAVALGMVLLAVGRTRIRQPHGDSASPALPAATTPEPSEGSAPASQPAIESERLPAAWHVDDAAGAVWLTADDAAQGRPGLSWSRPEPEVPSDTESADSPPQPQPQTRPLADDDDLR